MNEGKIIWLGLLPPENPSVGDHAQILAIDQWLQDFFPSRQVHRFYRRNPPPEGLQDWDMLVQTVKADDIILIHSSGDFGSLFYWTGMENQSWQDFRRRLISTFPNNRIIQLPVTVFYHEHEGGQKTLQKDQEFYQGKKNITLMAREQASYKILDNNFDCKTLMVPDFVFYLKPALCYKERDGALLILRSDHETRFNLETKHRIKEAVEKVIRGVVLKDANYSECHLTDKNRKSYVGAVFDYYQNFRLVVTDKLHGVIFSVITKTPCIALDERIPHKISGYKDLLGQSVEFVSDIDEIPDAVRQILSEPYQETDLSYHFAALKEEVLSDV